MEQEVRAATKGDVPALVELMAEFYEESGYELNREHARRAFGDLLADPGLGVAWLMVAEQRAAGYVVLTFGFSMEFGGRDGFVDDLFVRREYRGRGMGRAALDTVRARCLAEGVRALHLEVGRDNTVAQRLYQGVGFRDNDRQLLTLRLAEPSHRA